MTPKEVIVAVAAHGLAGTGTQLPGAALGPAEWDAVMGLAERERIPGFLAQAAHDGAMGATPEQRGQAWELHARSMGHVLLLERQLLDLVGRLEAASIPYRVLKGSAVAHLVYARPSARSFVDIDLLVPGTSWDATAELLLAMGCRRQFGQPRPGFDRRFGKGTAFLTSEGYEIDLHRTFVAGPFAHLVDPEQLFSTSTTFELGGRPVLALGAVERFLHACLHAMLGDVPPRLVPLRDVAEMVLSAELDAEGALGLAASWRAQGVVAKAITTTWSTFRLADMVPLSVWAHRYQPSPADVRHLAAYAQGPDYTVQSFAGLRAVSGLGDKLAYLRALTLPDRDYLAGRDAGQLRRWLRAGRTLASWSRQSQPPVQGSDG